MKRIILIMGLLATGFILFPQNESNASTAKIEFEFAETYKPGSKSFIILAFIDSEYIGNLKAIQTEKQNTFGQSFNDYFLFGAKAGDLGEYNPGRKTALSCTNYGEHTLRIMLYLDNRMFKINDNVEEVKKDIALISTLTTNQSLNTAGQCRYYPNDFDARFSLRLMVVTNVTLNENEVLNMKFKKEGFSLGVMGDERFSIVK